MRKYGQDYSIDIIVLSKDNKHYVENFSCGNYAIDEYFKKESFTDNTSVTYMFIDKDADQLIACVTVACSAIFTESDAQEQFSTLLSAMEVKYLAVNEDYQHIPYKENTTRPSLSDYMFDYMIDYLWEMSHSQIGAAKIVLYSVPQAVNFYKRHGFKLFGETMYGDTGYYVEGCEPMYYDLN